MEMDLLKLKEAKPRAYDPYPIKHNGYYFDEVMALGTVLLINQKLMNLLYSVRKISGQRSLRTLADSISSIGNGIWNAAQWTTQKAIEVYV
jgi:hypothetical protein